MPLPAGPPQRKNGQLLSPGFVATIFPDAIGAHAHAEARAQGLTQLVVMLGNQLGRPVLDTTGLTGLYDFSLDFALPPLPGAPAGQGDTAAGEPMPNLTDAVQRELGLRLVSAKAQLEVIVIDKIDKVPTEN